MESFIKKIFDTAEVTGRSGKVYKLDYSIDLDEAKLISGIISGDASVTKTLEVGCAYGISSLVICSAIKDREGASHTIIDPFQSVEWDEVGIRNLEEAGFGFFNLIEKRSEFALPDLAESMRDGFDLVFIDGWHTFDHTLVDCFYATRLLRVGGYLVIDDAGFPSVRRVVDYLVNYPCYELCGSVNLKKKKKVRPMILRGLMYPVPREFWAKALSPSYYRWIFEDHLPDMVALKKVTEDGRNWDWHCDRF